MPSDVVRAMAKRHGVSVERVEKLWSKAKGVATERLGKRSGDDYYAYVVGILKKMMKEEVGDLKRAKRLAEWRGRVEDRRRAAKDLRERMAENLAWRRLRRRSRGLRG